MRIVALTFHDVIKSATGDAAKADPVYRVSIAELERLLARLHKLGYQTASSRNFRAWQRGELKLPERTVVLTFDDGYASHLDVVAPLLVRYKFSGTFFITTDLVGQPRYLTWQGLQKLVFLGMEIGSHGKSHRPLTSLPKDELEGELSESKRELEDRLGVPVHSIAAPGGFWSRAVSEAVERVGYESAWVSEIGTNGPETQPLALRRVVVRQPFSLEHVISMVEGWGPAFWWATSQQGLIRVLKRILGVYWYEQLKRRLVPNA